MTTLIFDIETIPDVAGIRQLGEIDGDLDDDEVVTYALQQRRVKTGHEFLPLHLQRVVTISCLMRKGASLKIWSLAAPELSEAEIIQRFFGGIDRFLPVLVSWNGNGFDLPVLHYRGMTYGVHASRYWDMGEGNFADSRDFRYNNYISRYHVRHLDLMDMLSLYQSRGAVPLDELAKLIGFPGKMGMDGSQVWSAWQAGQSQEIANYCETDVANTFLVYTRFRRMRGEITAEQEAEEHRLLQTTLHSLDGPHWQAFLAQWQTGRQ